jgi:hypothetical protein
MKGDIMENSLYEKPNGHLKKWAIAGVISSIIFAVSFVCTAVYYYQQVIQAYGVVPDGLSYVGLFLNVNGLFAAAVLVFFIGLFAAKKRSFFIPFMLWTILLTDLYFVMPGFTTMVQIFASYTGLQLMYYLGLLLPQTLLAILLVSFLAQRGSENKKPTRILAWISIAASVVLFVFQIINAAGKVSTMDFFGNMYNFSGAIAIAFIVCLSGVILLAAKKPCAKTAADEAAGKDNAEDEEYQDEELDEVVEKIAHQVCKEDRGPSQDGAPDED